MSDDSDEASVWVTSDVALPQGLLDAHTEGQLVFFVGAGASVDAPSSLPSFDALARDLARLARVPFTDGVAIDFFLGSMPSDFDVHVHARKLIATEASRPNSTHAALVRLAAASGPLRIVTTNFDDHLMAAATSAGIAIQDKWIGPALPLGSDFTGLVHLHGSVMRDDTRELVLTDGDFGRAYLTHAWATRFLLPMFQKFTVLFIGYSHDDPIMRYLGLGLPSGTPRYAMTDTETARDPKWARLGVTAIGYPVRDHDHSALLSALESWDVRARMGQFEHGARTREIVEAGPRLAPVDSDYLVGRLRTTDGARDFAQSTTSIEPELRVQWLNWVETLPEFRALFASGEGSDPSTILGNWFCETFIADAELSVAALHTVQRLGQSFSGSLFRAAGWAIDPLSEVDAVAGRRWRVLLATSVHGHSAPVVTEALLPYSPNHGPEHHSVLRAALRPFLVLKRRWFADDLEALATIPDAEVRWNTERDSLTAHVLTSADAAPAGDPALGTMLEDSLSAAYDLLDAYHGKRRWDGLSSGRSAIEPHEQDQYRDPIDAVIDGLRAYGEKYLPNRLDLIERWWSLGRTLFQRLALHLLAFDGSQTADEKLKWLLGRSLLYETDLKHEVYQVLGTAVGDASEEMRANLLTAAQEGPDYPSDIPDHDRHSAYATYNLLIWLTSVAPEWSQAIAALGGVQTANPAFAPREHPDFDRWMTSGTWGGKLPIEPEDFLRSFDEDSVATFGDLLSRDYSERNFEEPEWSDALSLIKRVVEDRPDIGEPLWILVDHRNGLDTRADDLRQAITEGWTSADLGEGIETAVRLVGTQVAILESTRSISRFLLEQILEQIECDESPALASMRQLALDLWSEHHETFTHSEGTDPLSFAPLYLNSWPGDLVQYWLSEIDRRWRRHRDNWSGLNDLERKALIQLLDEPNAFAATGPALASALFFMFAADPDFTRENLLPLFRNDETATLAWHPYLHHPRYNDKLLASGFLDCVIAEWDRLDALGQHDVQRPFFGVVASIVSFADIAPEARTSLLDRSVLADNGAHAAAFAEAVGHFLSGESIDGAEVWKRWLKTHLTARLDGIPRIAQPEELACWADSLPHLGESIPEALELLNGKQIGLGEHFSASALSEEALAAYGPALVEHYADRVRDSSPSGFLLQHRVRKLIEVIRVAIGDAGAQPILDAAFERGFLNSDGAD